LANLAIVWKAGIPHAFTSTKRLAQVIPERVIEEPPTVAGFCNQKTQKHL
jgi:hypothetical protein